MAKCPYCGNENPDASQFCAWCGRKKPDDLYLNADQFSEPWTYVPPRPAGQAQPGTFDPARPIEGAHPEPASDPWAAAQPAATPRTPKAAASDSWTAAQPDEPPKPPTSTPQEPPKTTNRLPVILTFAGIILIVVIAALVVPRFSSRQTPREAENNASAAATTAATTVATTAAPTTAKKALTVDDVDWTVQINKPAAELQGAKHWSDDTADYAYYIRNFSKNTDVYVVITNKTNKDIRIDLTARVKDASGAFIGQNARQRVVRLCAGRTKTEWLGWDGPIRADSIEFKPEYSDLSSYRDIVPDLNVKVEPYWVGVYGVTVDITNQGAEAADVTAHALFLDAAGNIVGHYRKYFYTIEAGATSINDLYCHEPFEKFELYIYGGDD